METYQATARKTGLGLQVDAHSRGFHHFFDEPRNSGGTNTGMNPVELLLSTLGASLQSTAQQLKQTEEFEFQKLIIQLDGDLDPAGFMGDPNIRNGFQEIRVNFQYETKMTQKQCEDFSKRVFVKCPIVDLLTNGIHPVVDRTMKG
ncbi:MAG TPA: OsmC family protein [Candidatus Limosilactobacillus faecipullorum]|nr:OsmC family protein [Candidatus Limosilactobacillus faecipullorum]